MAVRPPRFRVQYRVRPRPVAGRLRSVCNRPTVASPATPADPTDSRRRRPIGVRVSAATRKGGGCRHVAVAVPLGAPSSRFLADPDVLETDSGVYVDDRRPVTILPFSHTDVTSRHEFSKSSLECACIFLRKREIARAASINLGVVTPTFELIDAIVISEVKLLGFLDRGRALNAKGTRILFFLQKCVPMWTEGA